MHFEKIKFGTKSMDFGKKKLFSKCVHISNRYFYQTFENFLEDIKLFFKLTWAEGSSELSDQKLSVVRRRRSFNQTWHKASLGEGI